MTSGWKRLVDLAEAEVHRTIGRLPKRLRGHALSLPVTCERHPNQAILDDGFEPDLLGLYIGPSFGDLESAPTDLPPQIILFLENLWDFAEGDEAVFQDEVRITYLHELGHYLGLDEEDLEERGLD